jgi:hypothetical protein
MRGCSKFSVRAEKVRQTSAIQSFRPQIASLPKFGDISAIIGVVSVDIVQLYSDKVMVHDRTINGEATQKSQARLSTSAEFATRDAAKARLRADRLRYSRSTAFVALA